MILDSAPPSLPAPATHSSTTIQINNSPAVLCTIPIRNIVTKIRIAARQIELIQFLSAQQRSIAHAVGAIDEAKRQNRFRERGLRHVTEEWLDVAQGEVKAWLGPVKEMVEMVEAVGRNGVEGSREREDGGGKREA